MIFQFIRSYPLTCYSLVYNDGLTINAWFIGIPSNVIQGY